MTCFQPFLLILALVLFLPQTGIAQSDDAKDAFALGTSLFSQKKYDEAAAQFRLAYDLKPTWRLLYNIAQAEAAARHYGIALESFERYLSEGGDEIDVQRRNEVLEEVRKLRDMVGDLKVTGPESAGVFVDDVKRGVLPLVASIAISAGVEHTVEIRAGDEILLQQNVRVRSAKAVAVNVPQKADAAPASASAPEAQNATLPQVEKNTDTTEPSRSKLLTAGIIAMGVGSATLIGAAITGGMAVSKKNDLAEKCDENDICYGGGTQDIDDSRQNLALATDILLVTGGVIAATGIVLTVIALRKKEAVQARLRPALVPGFAGFSVQGRF